MQAAKLSSFLTLIISSFTPIKCLPATPTTQIPEADWNAQLSKAENLFFPQQETFRSNTDGNLDPVIFRKLPDVHLTRAKYNVNAFINYMALAQEFDKLIDALNDLHYEVTGELSNPEYPEVLLHEEYQIQYQQKSPEGSRIFEYKKQLRILSTEIIFMKNNVINNKHNFLEAFHVQLPQKPPKGGPSANFTSENTRYKRNIFKAIWNFVFGSSDSENINVLKRNVKILQQNGKLRDEYLGKLTDTVNLLQANQKDTINYLDSLSFEFSRLNYTLDKVTREVQLLTIDKAFILSLLQYRGRMSTIQGGHAQLQITVGSVLRYLDSISKSQIVPSMLRPQKLLAILNMVENNLLSKPNLALPLPKEKVFEYYKILEITSMIHGQYLFVMVSLPLVYAGLSLDIYKVYSLPYFNPTLGRFISYDIDNHYFALSRDGQYICFLSDQQASSCLLSKGRFCELTSALFATDVIDLCVYHVFKNNQEGIERTCKVVLSKEFSKRVMLLDENLYYLALKNNTKIQLNCVHSTTYTVLQAPMAFLNVPSGCTAVNSEIEILGSNILTSEIDGDGLVEQTQQYITSFEKSKSFRLTKLIDFGNFTPSEISLLRRKFNSTGQTTKLSYSEIQAGVESIDENYSEDGLSTPVIILIAVLSTVVFSMIIVSILYLRHKRYIKFPRFNPSRPSTSASVHFKVDPEDPEGQVSLPLNPNQAKESQTPGEQPQSKRTSRRELREAMKFLESNYDADFSKYLAKIESTEKGKLKAKSTQ